EALDLGEEAHAERIAIEQPDGVMRIDGRHQTMAGVANRIQGAGGHKYGDARDRKIHETAVLCPSALGLDPSPVAAWWRASAASNTAATRGAVPCSEEGCSV